MELTIDGCVVELTDENYIGFRCRSKNNKHESRFYYTIDDNNLCVILDMDDSVDMEISDFYSLTPHTHDFLDTMVNGIGCDVVLFDNTNMMREDKSSTMWRTL